MDIAGIMKSHHTRKDALHGVSSHAIAIVHIGIIELLYGGQHFAFAVLELSGNDVVEHHSFQIFADDVIVFRAQGIVVLHLYHAVHPDEIVVIELDGCLTTGTADDFFVFDFDFLDGDLTLHACLGNALTEINYSHTTFTEDVLGVVEDVCATIFTF